MILREDKMPGERRVLEDIAKLSNKELEEIFRNGKAPDPDKLIGWEFRGLNFSWFTKLLGIKKFKKGFYKKGDQYWGYNINVYQGPIEEPWRCKPVDHNPKRMGFYSVKKTVKDELDDDVSSALILNYSDGKNWPWEGGGFLRDFLRQIDHDNDDLYLGKAYLTIFRARIMPGFFVLERDRKTPTKIENKEREITGIR